MLGLNYFQSTGTFIISFDLLNNSYPLQMRAVKPGGVEHLVVVIGDQSLVTEHRRNLTPPPSDQSSHHHSYLCPTCNKQLICCHPLFIDEHDVVENIIVHSISWLLSHSSPWT